MKHSSVFSNLTLSKSKTSLMFALSVALGVLAILLICALLFRNVLYQYFTPNKLQVFRVFHTSLDSSAPVNPGSPIGGVYMAPITKEAVVLDQVNSSGETGIGVLQNEVHRLNANVTILKGAVAGLQPAAIYSGSCKNKGEVRYQLKPVANGQSISTLPVESIAVLLTQLPLTISVQSNTGQEVACGDIIP